jgi:DNA-binding NarL/FixJ family response regulator
VVRVFHCDDSLAYRRLVRAMLQTEEGIEMVGEAADRDALLEGLAQTRPDVLLLDMVRAVTDADLPPGLVVVVLSGHLPEHVDPGIRELCAAYVTKSTAFAALARTIRECAMRTNVE